MTLSKFDSLPSELIVEISDYLDGCDLYYAFYHLNRRINVILDHQCCRLHVSFNRISKLKFDFYCNTILSCIHKHVISLTLSGDKSSTPGQLASFLSRFNSLTDTFNKLESFKLIGYTKSDVEVLIPQLSIMPQLKQLSIGDYQRLMPFNIDSNELFAENILLPISLRCLAFPYKISDQWFQTLTTRESFVERLHVHQIHINVLYSFLLRLPYLKSFTAVVTGINQRNLFDESPLQISSAIHKLRNLNINITDQVSFDNFSWLLKHFTELHSLKLEALNPELEFFNAQRWEEILPANLCLLGFDMTMTFPGDYNHLELSTSFQSQYWISHGWFVQCHSRDRGQFLRLSTVHSPVVTILYWPDDETLLSSSSTTTTIYQNVSHIELWWNLLRSSHSICPKVRSIEFYGVSDYNSEESIHPNILQFLHCPSFEHIIINNNIPISHRRFADILIESLASIQILTCSAQWLQALLQEKQYEWICLLVTQLIRKLIINDNGMDMSIINLIGLCRTFVNLQEITIRVMSKTDMFFILNTLDKLTMASFELSNEVLNDDISHVKLIEENTSLDNFIIRGQATMLNTYKLSLWIGSRRTSYSLQTTNYLYLQHKMTH